MTTHDPISRAAEFWASVASAEAQRRELARVTHEMRAKKQARVAANDEPELSQLPAEFSPEKRND